ncbi:MAG: hypothetical protein AAF393_00255 [Pseudomonadota bacterium]
MKRIALVVAAFGFATGVQAHEVVSHTHAVTHTHDTHTTKRTTTRTVSLKCYRGPWDDVIWDRPEGVFLDSLRALGYNSTDALAIGETICRDRNLVGNPSGMRSKLQDIIRANPPRRG